MVDLKPMRSSIDQKMGQRSLLSQQKLKAEESIAFNSSLLEKTLQARAIIQTVAKNTQSQIEYHISGLVTMALASVFPDPYEFQLKFVERRNSTEADLIFKKNENETDDILNNGGGGVADIASFAFRVALWSLKKSRATFILDEPDKFLHSPVYQEKASQMMKELCNKLGVQIIMVSDQNTQQENADKNIRITMCNGISEVVNG